MTNRVDAWIVRFIIRTLDTAVGSPYALVRFAPRVLRAAGLWTADLFSRRAGTVVGPIITDIGRSFFRGVWVVVAMGLTLAAALRAVAVAVGPLVEPIVEAAAVKLLVADGIPLALAVFLSARTGATMAARLGPLPALRGLPRMTIRTDDIRELILPSLAASPVTGVAFYYLVVLCAAAGYQAVGPLPGAAVEAFGLTVPSAWRAGVDTGLAKSAIFAFVVAYTGAALGTRAAERYRRELPETADVHRAVWESAMLGVLVCLLVTLAWSTLEEVAS